METHDTKNCVATLLVNVYKFDLTHGSIREKTLKNGTIICIICDGGWSDNEESLRAFAKNEPLIHGLFWYANKTGGIHIYKIKNKSLQEFCAGASNKIICDTCGRKFLCSIYKLNHVWANN